MGHVFVVKFFKKVASAVTFFIYSKLLCAPHFSFTRLTTKTQSQRDFLMYSSVNGDCYLYNDNARILKKLHENTTPSQLPISQSTEARQS